MKEYGVISKEDEAARGIQPIENWNHYDVSYSDAPEWTFATDQKLMRIAKTAEPEREGRHSSVSV